MAQSNNARESRVFTTRRYCTYRLLRKNFVKFVWKRSVGVKFSHTINSSAIFTTNEQVVANFLVTCL